MQQKAANADFLVQGTGGTSHAPCGKQLFLAVAVPFTTNLTLPLLPSYVPVVSPALPFKILIIVQKCLLKFPGMYAKSNFK